MLYLRYLFLIRFRFDRLYHRRHSWSENSKEFLDLVPVKIRLDRWLSTNPQTCLIHRARVNLDPQYVMLVEVAFEVEEEPLEEKQNIKSG